MSARVGDNHEPAARAADLQPAAPSAEEVPAQSATSPTTGAIGTTAPTPTGGANSRRVQFSPCASLIGGGQDAVGHRTADPPASPVSEAAAPSAHAQAAARTAHQSASAWHCHEHLFPRNRRRAGAEEPTLATVPEKARLHLSLDGTLSPPRSHSPPPAAADAGLGPSGNRFSALDHPEVPFDGDDDDILAVLRWRCAVISRRLCRSAHSGAAAGEAIATLVAGGASARARRSTPLPRRRFRRLSLVLTQPWWRRSALLLS